MNRSLAFFLMILVALAAAAGGWLAGRRQATNAAGHATHGDAPPGGARKILYYQSGMHPWIRSDKPGKCTICGMPLTPVYEGETGAPAMAGVVPLSSNNISVLQVRTARIERRALERTLRVSGALDDDDTKHRRLSAYIEGRIEKLNIDHVGATVEEGQPLATFHSPMLLGLEREYVGVASQLAQATPALKAELESLKRSAETRLRLMGLTTAQIEAMPQRKEGEHLFEILAPISGTVVSRDVYEGQYVKEGDRLFEIADFSTMWFQFDAYERDLAWLKVGQFVDVTTPSVPGKVFKASIRFINPNLNEATRTAKVRVEIQNPWIEEGGLRRRELLHRLYAEGLVRVQLGEALAVPRSAVLNASGKPVVYVSLSEGHYQARFVELGRSTDDYYEALSGLKAGDEVVVSGNLLIDAQAQIQNSAEPSPRSAPGPSPAPAPTGSLIAPTADEAAFVVDFLNRFDRVRKTLAQDDLEGFRAAIATLSPSARSLSEKLGARAEWKPWTEKLEKGSAFAPSANLAEARKQFHALNESVVAMARAARSITHLPQLKFYQCPMAGRAFPGAPKSAIWPQLQGPLENPYMGKDMIDCGTEVKP
ncbi:MAG: efflux RND transporter periplasmic adaptor subunit [Verrucomicrobia bacterium]|nr:efflux RND transporter periplasmic adaptor subunit [Verrucomicrobiota bacterium]MBI3871158.1 efflux RND transporter periplasmic adaptor subunit [Verrucomicrobiota bacterium]